MSTSDEAKAARIASCNLRSGRDEQGIAERELYPDRSTASLSFPEFMAAARVAKARLAERGEWKESDIERRTAARSRTTLPPDHSIHDEDR